jgi:hypothetical protein
MRPVLTCLTLVRYVIVYSRVEGFVALEQRCLEPWVPDAAR